MKAPAYRFVDRWLVPYPIEPVYDLMAVKGRRVLKVSVKGTQEPGWVLTGALKKGRSYEEAADAWLRKHGVDLVFMFVQFLGVYLSALAGNAGPVFTHPGRWLPWNFCDA